MAKTVSASKTARFTRKKKATPKQKTPPVGKFNTAFCNNKMTYDECETAILRHYIDKNEAQNKQGEIESREVRKATALLENYLHKKQLVCYGGTAINNILPSEYRFYDPELDIPDYDFYSPTPIETAKEIADMYAAAGYTEVEAKAGVHRGTMKVFVNFVGIADITLLEPSLFAVLQKEAIKVDGILYAPANFLRMNAYIELSRPQGDVSRWEKVLKRLNLLDRFYPVKTPHDCQPFQRKMSGTMSNDQSQTIFAVVRDVLIREKVVFFGGYAISLYAQYMPQNRQRFVRQAMPDFDALSQDPEHTAQQVKAALLQAGITQVSLVERPALGEIIPPAYEIVVHNDTVAFLYQTRACHNFNRIQLPQQKKTVRVATIDTTLSLYLAFYYAVDRPYYDRVRILCLAHFLFDVQRSSKLLQKDILKRFNSSCLGKQATLADIKAEKTQLIRHYKTHKKDEEYDLHFFKYVP